MASIIKNPKEFLVDTTWDDTSAWNIKLLLDEECMAYVAWNTHSKELLVIDPKKEGLNECLQIISSLKGYRTLAVVDTHTHADHISCAHDIAQKLEAPLVMHERAPSKRVHIHISKTTALSTVAGKLQFIVTPGHTADGMSVLWGPFLFAGDTILFGDTGRDDLPTGDATAHYESLVEIKKFVNDTTLMLPGHDHKGGRASSWAVQLKVNASLTQVREKFISEAGDFRGKSPHLLKESLFENFK